VRFVTSLASISASAYHQQVAFLQAEGAGDSRKGRSVQAELFWQVGGGEVIWRRFDIEGCSLGQDERSVHSYSSSLTARVFTQTACNPTSMLSKSTLKTVVHRLHNQPLIQLLHNLSHIALSLYSIYHLPVALD
jgi:hypothetical protein